MWDLSTLANTQSNPQIRLVLQITVDGLRGDLLNYYQSGFSKEGFNHLAGKGTVYTDAHYQHANTETIVGHATLATGTFLSLYGMVGNVWFDRKTGELSYNVEDADAPILPSREEISESEQVDPAQKLARTKGCSPAVLLAPTSVDGLSAYYGGRSKVFEVSGKKAVALWRWLVKSARRFGYLPIMVILLPATTIILSGRISGTDNARLNNTLEPNGNYHRIYPPTCWSSKMIVHTRWT